MNYPKCDHICEECGEHETRAYSSVVINELQERQLCFLCNFWYNKILMKDDPNVARINSKHWIIGDENASQYFRGCAGHLFAIKFDDGREVTTTNLWHQGEIPERFRARLPNNAVFL